MSADSGFQYIIEADGSRKNYWSDIYRYRELFYILAWRDVAVRYKQTLIGVLWAVIRPLLMMAIFVVVFSKIANLPSEGVPYPIYVFAAMLPWMFFMTAFNDAGNSLIGNTALISKVYFPRLIMPAAAVIVSVVDLMFAMFILLLLMLVYGVVPDWHILLLPFFLLLGAAAALGAGLLVAAANVRYRDFKFIAPFVSQVGMYISPVGFGTVVVPEAFRVYFYLNPMVAVIDGFRWCISGGMTAFDPLSLYISIAVTAVILFTGFRYFRATERSFADII